MKDIRIAICVPTTGLCSSWFAHSLNGVMGFGNSLAARADSESIAITLFMQESSVVHANRELLVKMAIDWKATHLMFLDEDMIFHPTVLSMLLGRRQPFVGCNYPKRGMPITFTAVRPDMKGHIITRPESTGLEEAAYTGFGVSLIEMQVFEKTPQPWFLPLWDVTSSGYTTEDNPFCARIKAAGFPVFVDHDASKLVGHRGAFTFEWHMWTPPVEQKSAEVVNLKTEGKSS